MSDFPSRHELDDELLSAYLDDELSPQERAAVEVRLAEDAAAREMLHQLRAVSQAVQGLPQEIVGHDLGESVLRQATQTGPAIAPLVSPTTESNGRSPDRAGQPEDSFPKFTIGRSPRGWFWASLAVAAALLVIFVV
jgi:anti-sigma factor RsiW